MRYTPGPWKVCNTADIFTELGATNAYGESCPQNDGWMIANCDDGRLSFEEVQANARLIAAAPELLEALKAAVAFGMVPSMSARSGGACAYVEQLRIADQIRDAIAKATGDA